MASKNRLTPEQRKRFYWAIRPIARSPYGGMSVNHKEYNAGQFLPGRRIYDQGIPKEHEQVMPPALDHGHLKSIDLHAIEPTWDTQGKASRNGYGGVIFNERGQVLMIEPTDHFAGYHWTFPKGGIDPGEHPVDAGLREVKEESGHDGEILGLVPGRFPSAAGTGHAHYFIMRSKGQTSEPHWETQGMKWATPEEAHRLIDQTEIVSGRDRDHKVLDMAVAHMKRIQSDPQANVHLQPAAQTPVVQPRQTYSKVPPNSCGGHCECIHCLAEQALNRVLYSQVQRYRHNRIRRILYESKDTSRQSGSGSHYDGWIPKWKENVTPTEFIAARNNTKYPGFLSPLEESDIANHKLILSHDHKVGSAVSPDGDIQNVFNNGGPKGAGVEALIESIHHGGHTLDAFGPYLPHLYTQLGFRETGRVKFNREYAPSGWNFDHHGEPDVVFMSRDPKAQIDVNSLRQQALSKDLWQPHSHSGRYFDDWNRAKAHSRGTGVAEPYTSPSRSNGGEKPLASNPGSSTSGGRLVALAEQGHQQSQSSSSTVRSLIQPQSSPSRNRDILDRIRRNS